MGETVEVTGVSEVPGVGVSVTSVRALEFRRNEARYAAAAVSSRLLPGSGAKTGPLTLVDTGPVDLPDDGWHRIRTLLSGICGSDLSTIEGRASRYFEPWISFPFTPGHEVVGTLEDGTRVVLEPVLGHEARGFEPPFEGAAPGDGDDYRHLVGGDLEPGIQIGYCASTGGGWSSEFVAHRSQLHPVSDQLSDEAAVMIEPTAVGVHSALRSPIAAGDTVVVLGAGTAGLTTVAALRAFTDAGSIIVGAKYPEQAEQARRLGADQVVKPSELARAVRRTSGSFLIGDDLSGGADVVIDAVGSEASVAEAIGITRPRGTVVLVGMPGRISIDMTALWHRETALVGAYTYGTETLADGSRRTSFDLAAELVASADLGQLVSATYAIEDYEDALAHAVNAGKRGSIKVCFDLR
ncbi:MAG: threonine dehydrogenase-like Zn-dependent dehydrogenase [Acidimicrobiales bacterium]